MSMQHMTGGEVRAALEKLGLNQSDAARMLGRDARTVRRWVKGGCEDKLVIFLLRVWVDMPALFIPQRKWFFMCKKMQIGEGVPHNL